MSVILEKMDDEFIFDTEHIIMNYLKMNNFNPECFKGTNIQISQNIISIQKNIDIQNSQKFSSDYFLQLIQSPFALDLISPFISSFPNSDLGLFMAVILTKNCIEFSQNLNNSSELFEKYKTGILSIYHAVLPKEKKPKIIENICSSITVLIIIGFQGHWTCGIDQLISAAKQGEANSENNLIATLILANIENIFNELEKKLDKKTSKFILSLIDGYSNVINDYINFLISKNFSGDKSTFVNSDLFKAFIGILQSANLFKINIIKVSGLLNFLINCISYIDVNQDFVGKLCLIFDNVFKSKDNFLKYDYDKNTKLNDFILFMNNLNNNEEYIEIINCIKMIQNIQKYYSEKDVKNKFNNPKDFQNLFAFGNIFNSILENYGYLYFIPDIDDIIQNAINFFINIKIYKINQIFFSCLDDIYSIFQMNYNFENYPMEIRADKKNKFNNFLYSMQNIVLQNMNLTKDEINIINIDADINTTKLISEAHQLDKYIDNLLKKGIEDDDKIEFIENSDGFYNTIYDIISLSFNNKDYCDKLCKYFISSTENNDYITINSLMNVFNFLSFQIINEQADVIFNLIDFAFQKKEILFQNHRFILQFIKLIYKNNIQIAKNKNCLNLIIDSLLGREFYSEKFRDIVVILVNKLIIISYQSYKLSDEDDFIINKNIDNDKQSINNIFSIISNFLNDNLLKLNHILLYKLIDAFYHSLFYTIALNINNIESIIIVSEKLINDANKILVNSNNNESTLKYLFIVWSIIKNIGKEKKEMLFNLLNKEDSSHNQKESYFIIIQKNILNIINSNKINFNNNIIDAIILLNNSLVSIIKDKSIIYFDYFNQIISLLISMNPNYLKTYSLTLNLYTQIFNYNQNSDKYNDISQIGYDALNSMNITYNNVKTENEAIYLANKQTEFLSLYIKKSTHFINNLNILILDQTFNNIITIFEKSNYKEFSINFINLIKTLLELSLNNNIIEKLLKDKYIEKIIKSIINHIHYFDATYQKCYLICFNIFELCINSQYQSKIYQALKEIYNDEKLIEVIINYISIIKDNKNIKGLDKKIKEFISDLDELYYGMDKVKHDFVEKYIDEINNIVNGNINNNIQNIKINPNSQVYMDLFPKKIES